MDEDALHHDELKEVQPPGAATLLDVGRDRGAERRPGGIREGLQKERELVDTTERFNEVDMQVGDCTGGPIQRRTIQKLETRRRRAITLLSKGQSGVMG